MSSSELGSRALFGIAGGMAGLAAMRLYWRAATVLRGEDPRGLTAEGPPRALDEVSVVGRQHQEGESSTAAVGRKAYEEATGEEPDRAQKTWLSYGVHWSYGLLMAGGYGALRGRQDGLDVPGGLAFGTGLWLLGDELVVPLLGLAEGPTAYPAAQHAHRLGAHLAYGAATAAAAQVLHSLLRPRPASRLPRRATAVFLKWKLLGALIRRVLR